MEQVKVSQLATEFQMQNSVVITELKKIGVWVPSPETPVDHDIADRIRRRLQMMLELEVQEQEKAREKEEEKKKKKAAPARARKRIKELGTPRKRPARVEAADAEQPQVLSMSLQPRKGKATYRRVEAPGDEEELQKVEVSIDDEPIMERAEARVSAEQLEQVMQEPSPDELRGTVRAPLPPKEVQEPPAEEEPVAEEPAAEEVEAAEEPARVEEVAAAEEAVEPAEPEIREVVFSEKVTVKELAEALRVKSGEILKELMSRGIMASINQVLDEPLVEEISESYQVIARVVSYEEAAAEEELVEESPEDLHTRAPVVTVMGHVDHGKTTLLDSLRQTQVAAGEAGGITQHIGAYHVDVDGRRIVFIDTPGHEAFTRMRARGAQATDIVVLVVAADDGVMPQTVEAINHARAAEVPIIVAINKIDRPDANPQKVRQALSEQGLLAEDWGGDVVTVEVSALEGRNLDGLLEMILLTADLLELQANPDRSASGVILEAKMEKGRGAVATVLVQNGTLRQGDVFIAGHSHGKIRAIFGDRGQPIDEAEPSSGVEILGLQGVPQAGDSFQVVEDPARAREIVEYRQAQLREQELSRSAKVSLDQLYAQMQAGEVKELPLVIKADTQGTLEVLADSLEQLSTEKVKINVIQKAVGAISESDVVLASASKAIVVGFNVRPERNAQEAAEHEKVEIRLYTVIYRLTEDISQAMVGLLEPTFRETTVARVEVRETFRVPKFGTIAGSYVQEGTVTRNADVRLLRDNVVIYEGNIDSLRRFKDDVGEVKNGYECGISIANYNDIKVGDVIEVYERVEVAPELR